MKYTLTKLMKDKKQCNALAKEGFVFRDHNGIFAFDFAVQPARQIHTEIFNTLFEMGGDDFMQYLLERGGTCVANDPNAATGTRPIKGSDKFFLKANTSKVLAVSSVLTAILGWAEYSDDFDGDAVMLYTLDEEDFDDVTVDDDESVDFDDTDEDASFDLSGPDWYVDGERAFRTSPIHKNCFLATKKDKLCFYDEDQNQFVTLFWNEGFERMPLDGMVTCEALNDLYEENFGYKYQITEGGKYGFISKYFAQITKPVFDDIAVASDKWGRTFLVAHRAHEEDVFNSPFAEDNSSKEAETETIDLFYSYSAYYHDGNPESERLEDYWFQYLSPAFKNVDTCYKADSFVRLDFETDEEGNSAVLYKPYDSAPHAICKIKKNGDEWYETVWQVKHADGFMTMTSHNKEIKYPCSFINAETCLRALQPVDLGYEIINLLEWSENYIAILRKEGYYAAATVSFEKKPEIQKWLTPFAFTAMQNMNTRFLLVDRFGKKGVFDCLNETYPVPCDYETIVRSSDFFSGAFRVERMGFTGVIDNDGTWIEHLHKKQD